jgi:hypothetical protein
VDAENERVCVHTPIQPPRCVKKTLNYKERWREREHEIVMEMHQTGLLINKHSMAAAAARRIKIRRDIS